MRVLGIDPSTRMGLVVIDYDEHLSRIKTVYKTEYRSKRFEMERLGDIGEAVIKTCEKYHPQLIGVEGYSFGSKFNHEIMYSVGTVIRYFLWQSEYAYRIIPPTTLKKFVTGKGNSKKDLMMLGVYKTWGFDTQNDNVADAYALAMYTLYESLGIADEKGVWLKGDAAHLKII
jgi:crossover junction endodeoxyribonuclease RuvC